MGKINKKLKAFFTGKTFRRIISYVLIALVLFVSGYVVSKINKPEEQLVDVRALKSVLIESSELTTAKLNLTCISDFKDTGISILTKADFTMVYDVTVRAGIDMEKIDISKDDILKVVRISIPSATIQSSNVNPGTIKYFDEKLSLFNVNEKEDSDKAQKLAEDDAVEKAKSSGILKMADDQSETLVKGLLSSLIPDEYKIEITKQLI